MIGIKGMELPKSCKECAFCEEFCEEKFCQMYQIIKSLVGDER